MTDYLSEETQQMLAVVDKYEDGELSMEEAVKMIQKFTPLKAQRIQEILNGVERKNLLKFQQKASQQPDKNIWGKTCQQTMKVFFVHHLKEHVFGLILPLIAKAFTAKTTSTIQFIEITS